MKKKKSNFVFGKGQRLKPRRKVKPKEASK